MLVAKNPPIETLLAPEKFVPMMFSVVPPVVGPKFGSTEVMVGGLVLV